MAPVRIWTTNQYLTTGSGGYALGGEKACQRRQHICLHPACPTAYEQDEVLCDSSGYASPKGSGPQVSCQIYPSARSIRRMGRVICNYFFSVAPRLTILFPYFFLSESAALDT